MRILIVEEETDGVVNLSDLEALSLESPDVTDIDGIVEHLNALQDDDENIFKAVIAVIRTDLGLDEPDDEDDYDDISSLDTVKVYFGDLNSESDEIYYRVLSQKIASIINGTWFRYNPEENMMEIPEHNEASCEDGDDNSTTDQASIEGDAEGGGGINDDAEDELVEDEGNDLADEWNEDQAEHIPRDESELGLDNDETHYNGIPRPQEMPVPRATSQQLEQLAMRAQARIARGTDSRAANGSIVIKSNFQPPERSPAFTRWEPARPRPDLDMQTFIYKGTNITVFESKARAPLELERGA